MSKTLVLFGATGQQGLSILSTIQHDPTLSTTLSLRAITRSPRHQQPSPSQPKVSPSSRRPRRRRLHRPRRDLKDANIVILITTSQYDEHLRAREWTHPSPQAGYFGPETERRVRETVQRVRGLTGLEEFARRELADL